MLTSYGLILAHDEVLCGLGKAVQPHGNQIRIIETMANVFKSKYTESTPLHPSHLNKWSIIEDLEITLRVGPH